MDWEVTRLPLLLAAAGQGSRAMQLVEGYLEAGAEGTDSARYPRFARQLRRWVDAGMPAVPPVEETLRRLPPLRGMPQRPSFRGARDTAQEKKALAESVRPAAKGKTREQLSALLSEAFTANGVDVSPSEVSLRAQAMGLDQRPFGRTLRTIRGLGMLRNVGRDTANRLGERTGTEPEWLQPPPKASYPMPSGSRHQWAIVQLSPSSQGWLTRAAAEASRPLGPFTQVDAWLTVESEPVANGGDQVVVHLGEHSVGTLSAEDGRRMSTYLAAADFYDEYARVRARIFTQPGDAEPATLEIKLPPP